MELKISREELINLIGEKESFVEGLALGEFKNKGFLTYEEVKENLTIEFSVSYGLEDYFDSVVGPAMVKTQQEGAVFVPYYCGSPAEKLLQFHVYLVMWFKVKELLSHI